MHWRSIIAVFSGTILVCWIFPKLWYSRTAVDQAPVWCRIKTQTGDWSFDSIPINKSAEAVLVADEMLNGEFHHRISGVVRVFIANRRKEDSNEIGLFVHTPDRCWTEAGWRIERSQPDQVEMPMGAMKIPFERRIFCCKSERELVYFAGFVGGQPLPYRLDHNLGVGQRFQAGQPGERTGTALRLSSLRLWRRAWEAFLSRRELLGPKQFIRLSTPIEGMNSEAAERTLRGFITECLEAGDNANQVASDARSKPERIAR